MSKKRLLLAGSHAATTAAATVEEIKKQKLDWSVYWIGKKWATEEKKSHTLEYEILPKLGVVFKHLESGKIQTKFTRHTISALLKIPFGFIHAGLLVLNIKPDLVLSFGGAAGALVSFWGWLLGKPVIIHEQTSSAGRANKKSAFFAKKIALSRESSAVYFPKDKVVITGDPISKKILNLSILTPSERVGTILVTGGSRGSRWINDAIKPILATLLRDYKILLLCGSEHKSEFSIINPKLKVYGRVSPSLYAKLLNKSDMVISRAGSNTVSELVVARKPCILIPIPWSYLDEQTKNARYAENIGLARIINQKDLTPKVLLEEIKLMVKNYPSIINKTQNIVSIDINATKSLVNLLRSYLS